MNQLYPTVPDADTMGGDAVDEGATAIVLGKPAPVEGTLASNGVVYDEEPSYGAGHNRVGATCHVPDRHGFGNRHGWKIVVGTDAPHRRDRSG